jgi:hypothetical protein
MRTVAPHACALAKRLPRRRCPAGNKRGGLLCSNDATTAAPRVAARGGGTHVQVRFRHGNSRAHAQTTLTQHTTQRSHTHTALPKRHLTCENTRHTYTKTMRQRRRRVGTVATPAPECGIALATTMRVHTTAIRRCRVRYAAKQHLKCRFRCASTHTSTQQIAREHAAKRRRTLRCSPSRTGGAP